MSIFGGIGKIFGAAGDVLKAPFKLLSGDPSAITDVIKAPFKAVGGVLETGLGVVTLPIRLPLAILGSMFGMGGGSQQAQLGAQNAIGGHMSQNQSPGYW